MIRSLVLINQSTYVHFAQARLIRRLHNYTHGLP